MDSLTISIDPDEIPSIWLPMAFGRLAGNAAARPANARAAGARPADHRDGASGN